MVSGGCHFLSCNDEKRFGEVQEVLLCVLFLFVSFAPEVQRRATSAGYAHLYRQIQSGKRFGANELHVLHVQLVGPETPPTLGLAIQMGIVGWSFIQVLQEGLACVILIVYYQYCYSCYFEVPGVTVCLVFSCALILEKCEALLMLYESMNLFALRFQLLIRLFRHGLGEISAMDKSIWNQSNSKENREKQ